MQFNAINLATTCILLDTPVLKIMQLVLLLFFMYLVTISKSFCYILHCLRLKEGVRVRVKFLKKKSVSLHCPNYCFALTFYTLFSYFQSFFLFDQKLNYYFSNINSWARISKLFFLISG